MSFFSKNLRYLRLAHKMSQDGFAKAVGLNRGNIASYEKALAEPRSSRLLTIARYFNVSLEAMIEEDFEASGKDIARISNNPTPALTEEEVDAARAEILRLGRMLNGLQEFRLMRQEGPEFSARNARDLEVDFDRLMAVAEQMQKLLNRLEKRLHV